MHSCKSNDKNEEYDDRRKYMRRCIQLARNGICHAAPNPMVGAVIVRDGKSSVKVITCGAGKDMPK